MRRPCEILHDRLSEYLGPHTTRTALRAFSQKLGFAPEALTTGQAKQVVLALRPTLKTLLGTEQRDRIVAKLNLELELHSS